MIWFAKGPILCAGGGGGLLGGGGEGLGRVVSACAELSCADAPAIVLSEKLMAMRQGKVEGA